MVTGGGGHGGVVNDGWVQVCGENARQQQRVEVEEHEVGGQTGGRWKQSTTWSCWEGLGTKVEPSTVRKAACEAGKAAWEDFLSQCPSDC
eukprot:758320-Hanusia_phi.AAC.4